MARIIVFSLITFDIRKICLVTMCSNESINIMHIFQEKQQQMEELNAKEEELLKGNPLLNNTPTSFSVKRRLAPFNIFVYS